MEYANPEALADTGWLADHLGQADLCVVDGSWHLPTLNRDARAEFEAGHLPGAVFFDIDDIADGSNPLPHMLPSAEKFAERVAKLGIGNGSRIVVYDATAMGSAARVWWTFRAFGHEPVAVLDGGLPKWLAEGGAVETGPVTPAPADYTARFNPAMVRGLEQIRANIEPQQEQLLDARTRGRFHATEPEPRQGLRGGHIPGSYNLPFGDLYDSETKSMKPAGDLKALYEGAGLDLARPVVTSCGSGVTACNLALGLHLIGARDVAIYDGSWTEWGGRDDTPIDT